jgi:bifunctional non-homologous end joining protein LigD
MSLAGYRNKRDFASTAEPHGKKSAAKGKTLEFVVQRHVSSHLHFDFRLELNGVLKSWAVPKGPSMNPAEKRLAVMVEDHPIEYIRFKGLIPEGNYGAGKVEIWDNGNYMPLISENEPDTENGFEMQLEHGSAKFLLNGKKLKGEFALVQLKKSPKNWLLIKHDDEYAVHGRYDISDKNAQDRQSHRKSR